MDPLGLLGEKAGNLENSLDCCIILLGMLGAEYYFCLCILSLRYTNFQPPPLN